MTDTVVTPLGRTCGANSGRTKSGEACASTLNLSETTGRCLFHDPERADELRQVRAAGGVAAADKRRLQRLERMTTAPENLPCFEPDTLERLACWHRWVMRAVATGEIDARTAREITGSLKELRPVLVQIGLEKRVKQLENELKKYKRLAGER